MLCDTAAKELQGAGFGLGMVLGDLEEELRDEQLAWLVSVDGPNTRFTGQLVPGRIWALRLISRAAWIAAI